MHTDTHLRLSSPSAVSTRSRKAMPQPARWSPLRCCIAAAQHGADARSWNESAQIWAVSSAGMATRITGASGDRLRIILRYDKGG